MSAATASGARGPIEATIAWSIEHRVLVLLATLAFVLWGNWSPFVAGRAGFVGELELLLAVVGLLFLCVGGGGFSLDRSFRKSRESSSR